MAAERDDTFLRLQEAVDAWADEVARTRNDLSEKLHVDFRADRPAFRLPARSRRNVDSNAGSSLLSAGQAVSSPVRETLPPLDGGGASVADAETYTQVAERDTIRLEAELAFAREQLHERNRAAQAAERAWMDTATQAEEAAQALGRAQIELEELRRQVRGKDWALTKARNELELIREERGDRGPQTFGAAREDAALRDRIDALAHELEAVRAKERKANASAESAMQRADTLAKEHARAQEVIQALNAQVNETAAHLRATGKELENARAELARRDDNAEAAEQLSAAETRVAEVEQAYESAENRIRELEQELTAAQESADTVQAAAEDRLEQLRADYDTLASSHMMLREEIVELQQAVIERDLDIERIRRESESLAPQRRAQDDEGARMDELAAVLAERSAALDELEQKGVGQEYLIGALKEELDAARESLENYELDYGLLAKALRAELDCLRKLAVERDFVIHHQGEELEALTRQVAERDAALQEAKRISEPLRQKAEAAARDRETLKHEMAALRAGIEEKEDALGSLRAELADLRNQLAAGPTSEELQAELEAKQAELDRSRDRIRYLRNLVKENNLDDPVSPETGLRSERFSVQATPREAGGDDEKLRPASAHTGGPCPSETIDLSRWQPHSDLQREVEETFSAQFPWPVVVLGAILAGGGLLAIGLAMVVFG